MRAAPASLRNRFTTLFVAFAIIATVLEGLLSWSAASRYLEESLDQRLVDIAGVAAGLKLKDELPFRWRTCWTCRFWPA